MKRQKNSSLKILKSPFDGGFLLFKEIHGNTGGNTEVEAINLAALAKNDGLASVCKTVRQASGFIAENERVGCFCVYEILGRLTFSVKHKCKARARVFSSVDLEIWEVFDIKMKDGTHGGANDFGIEMINGRFDDGEIIEIHGSGGADDGAQIACIGRIGKYEMISGGVKSGGEFGKFGDQKTAIFGAKDIEWFWRFDNFDMPLGQLFENAIEILAMISIGAQKDALDSVGARLQELETECGAKGIRNGRGMLITRKLHICLLQHTLA